jgi:hypothetical protein
MMAHSIHNASVTLGAELYWPCLIAFASDWGGALALLAAITWMSVREQQWITTFLSDEVELGTLSQENYEAARSYLRRVVMRTSALLSGDVKGWWELGRYFRLATELAFCKYRLSQFPTEKDTRSRAGELREQVKETSTRIGRIGTGIESPL